MNFEGKDYYEIKKNVQQYLEGEQRIVLPGGSWCIFCNKEICMTTKHMNVQKLLIVINKLIKDIEEAREE